MNWRQSAKKYFGKKFPVASSIIPRGWSLEFCPRFRQNYPTNHKGNPMFSQLLVNALIASSIYALVGVGFSLIYQVQRFFHFTHGLAYALGAYATFAFIKLGLPMCAAATLGICASGIFGILLDVCMIAPVRKHNGSALVLLLASIGAYIVGQNLISIFLGDDLKTLGSGNVSAGFQIFNARITSDQIVIIAGSAVAIAAVALWLYVSHFGKQIRTIACDEQLAVILGMPVGRIRLVVMAEIGRAHV